MKVDIIRSAVAFEIFDLDVVHHCRCFYFIDHLSSIIRQCVKVAPVLIILMYDLFHKIIMSAKCFIDRSLVFVNISNKIAFTASTIAISTVICISKTAILASCAHGIIQIPHRPCDKFVSVSHSITVEQDASCTNVIALRIFMHKIHLSKTFDVDIFCIILPGCRIFTISSSDGIPCLLKPRLNIIIGNTFQIFRALIDNSIVGQKVVTHLFDSYTVVFRRPVT